VGENLKSSLPSSGRIGRFARFLVEIGGAKAAEKVAVGIAGYEKLSLREKAAWWDGAMVRLERIFGQEKASEVMASCGRKCCGIQTRNKAKALKRESSSIGDFLQKLNKTGMGGGRLIQSGEKIITGGYDRCYCGQVSAASKPFENDLYCRCSEAWLKQYFEAIFETPVKVDFLQTILRGAKTCEFRITLM
jgi:hypothetical protein